MSPGPGPLQHQKVGDAAVVPVPQLAACSPAARPLLTMGAMAASLSETSAASAGRSLGSPAPQTMASSPRPESGADAVGILGGGDHGVDGHQPRAVGQLLGLADLPVQRPEVGFKGTLGEIRLLKARRRRWRGCPCRRRRLPPRPDRPGLTPTPMPPCKMGRGRRLSPDRYCHAASVGLQNGLTAGVQLLEDLPQGLDLMEHTGHLTGHDAAASPCRPQTRPGADRPG